MRELVVLHEEVTIQCDASEYGLGVHVALLHFASRTLSQMERQYAQIEKEFLSFVFSCERFRQYLTGREEIFSGVRPQATADNFPEANVAEAPRIQRGGKIQAWWADVCGRSFV